MRKIKKNLNITKPNDFSDIYDIHFKFTRGKYQSYHLQNIIAWDTESSNGFKLPNSPVVIKFDQDLYDEGIVYMYNTPTDKLDLDNPALKYVKLIDSCEPVGLMYLWQCAVEDGTGGIKLFFGRTWETWNDFLTMLTQEIKRQALLGFKSVDRDLENSLVDKKRLNIDISIWAHNLGHDWQFQRSAFNNKFVNKKCTAVFARKPRKPFKAAMRFNNLTIYYKDTFVLSQKSLKDWAKDCPNCPLNKIPDFDYLEIRTPEDQLSNQEILYAANDVLIMVYCLEYERELVGKLEDIPMTQTGKVRRVLVEKVAKKNQYWNYLCGYITKHYSPEEYRKRIQLYTGGYVHANNLHVSKTSEEDTIRCFDFSSSYPSALMGKYPTAGYEPCDVSEFDTLQQQDVEDPDFRWFAKIRLRNVCTNLFNTYWSLSKCIDPLDPIADNGRIYKAKEMTIYVTDLDWFTFRQAYHFDPDFEVLELQKGPADYLPKEMIEVILDYYFKKCTFKGDPTKISELIESKQLLNGIYGVFVYKAIADQVYFDGDWKTKKLDDYGDEMYYDLLFQIDEEKAFGFFDLGLICSAIARKRLWDFILHLDKSVWYADTDSIKGTFSDVDIKWIEDYNKTIKAREDKLAQHYNLDPKLFAPIVNGKEKRLGIMAREDDCKYFKTLGCKRYIAQHGDEIECTIAGLPKKAGSEKIKTFDDFNNYTLWTTKESQKACCYYNDDQPETHWTGRDGKVWISHDKYGVCLKPVTFDLSLSDDFVTFLSMIYGERIDEMDEEELQTPLYLLQH